MHYAQIHCHTIYSNRKIRESLTTPKALITKAIAVGIDAIAITDHNTMDGYRATLEIANNAGIVLIPAEEIDTDGRGQILAYGINKEITPYRHPIKIIEDIHAQNGIAIIPHPFDILHSMQDIENVVKFADGIEIYNSGATGNKRAVDFANNKNIKVKTCGADAHTYKVLDACLMEFDDKCTKSEDYLRSIKEGNFVNKIKTQKRKAFAIAAIAFLHAQILR